VAKTTRVVTTRVLDRAPIMRDADGREWSGGHTAEVVSEGPVSIELSPQELDRALVAETTRAAASAIVDQAEDATRTVAATLKHVLKKHLEHTETVAQLGRAEVNYERLTVIADAALAMLKEHPALRPLFEQCLKAAEPAAFARLESLKALHEVREELLTQQMAHIEAIVETFKKAATAP